MIDFATIQVGDRVRVVGMGAPGFAALGDILTIAKVQPNRVWARTDAGHEAYFALTCGAARLELADAAHQRLRQEGE